MSHSCFKFLLLLKHVFFSSILSTCSKKKCQQIVGTLRLCLNYNSHMLGVIFQAFQNVLALLWALPTNKPFWLQSKYLGSLLNIMKLGTKQKKSPHLTHSEKLIAILCYVGGLAFLPFVDNFKLSVFGNILIRLLLLSDSRTFKSTQTKEYTV